MAEAADGLTEAPAAHGYGPLASAPIKKAVNKTKAVKKPKPVIVVQKKLSPEEKPFTENKPSTEKKPSPDKKPLTGVELSTDTYKSRNEANEGQT